MRRGETPEDAAKPRIKLSDFEDDDLLTPAQVCTLLAISRSTLRRLEKAGSICRVALPMTHLYAARALKEVARKNNQKAEK